MAEQETILIVEDDRALREGIEINFLMQGYRVRTAASGDAGLQAVFDVKPDLVILDIMLPGINGLDILEEVRRVGNNVPILILSARGSVSQRVEGLGLGADDYLPKPFDLKELLARAEALIRRSRTREASLPLLEFGPLVINRTARSALMDGKQVELTSREFDLLVLLASSPDRTFTRENILERVWGWDFDGTPRTVDNFILSLRRKLESGPGTPRFIQTVRQVGYRFVSNGIEQ